MRPLICFCFALLAACASPSTPESSADAPDGLDDTSVAGTVTAVDLDPWTYDGDATIELATDDGPATVRIPARMNLCEAVGLATVSDLLVGDHVEARGERGADGAVTPCVSPDHQLVRDGETEAALYRGVFETGFETQAFSPCDQPDASWWVADADEDFWERHGSIRQRNNASEGRGMRMYVEATVVGRLSDEGEYGHLGAYSRRLTITETRDMAFLAVDPESTVTCRS